MGHYKNVLDRLEWEIALLESNDEECTDLKESFMSVFDVKHQFEEAVFQDLECTKQKQSKDLRAW